MANVPLTPNHTTVARGGSVTYRFRQALGHVSVLLGVIVAACSDAPIPTEISAPPTIRPIWEMDANWIRMSGPPRAS